MTEDRFGVETLIIKKTCIEYFVINYPYSNISFHSTNVLYVYAAAFHYYKPKRYFHEIFQTRKTVFEHIFKHREKSWKYDAQWSIFDELQDDMTWSWFPLLNFNESEKYASLSNTQTTNKTCQCYFTFSSAFPSMFIALIFTFLPSFSFVSWSLLSRLATSFMSFAAKSYAVLGWPKKCFSLEIQSYFSSICST